MLEPLPTGAWSFLAVTAAIATNTLSFAQVRFPARVPWIACTCRCHGYLADCLSDFNLHRPCTAWTCKSLNCKGAMFCRRQAFSAFTNDVIWLIVVSFFFAAVRLLNATTRRTWVPRLPTLQSWPALLGTAGNSRSSHYCKGQKRGVSEWSNCECMQAHVISQKAQLSNAVHQSMPVSHPRMRLATASKEYVAACRKSMLGWHKALTPYCAQLKGLQEGLG